MKLAEGLILPDDAATQVYAFMGRRGAGKTYGAGKLCELLLDAGQQIVVMDPVGNWYGLRLSADWKMAGFSVPVFGGIKGDIPLEPTAGKVVAELVAERGVSLVLDVSGFTKADQRRFVRDFCVELFEAKKRHKSALLVVFEEAQEFCPQHVQPGDAPMKGAVERLLKLGRNYGVGAALLSQRPQAVAKDCLNLAEVMLAFQLTGPHERKAIEGWVQEVGATGRDKLGGELPSLPEGTAFVWSPQWLSLFGKFKIAKKKTFDASATPKFNQPQKTGPLAPIDLNIIRVAMAATIEEAKAKDPTELRAEITRLRRELEAAKRTVSVKEQIVEVPIALDGIDDRLRVIAERVGGVREELSGLAGEVSSWNRKAGTPRPPRSHPINPDGHKSFRVTLPATYPPRRTEHTVSRNNGKSDLPRGAMDMLRALVALPAGLSRTQIATLAVLAPSSGTFSTYLSMLKTRGLILLDEEADSFTATPAGVAFAGSVEKPMGPIRLLQLWRDKMPGKAKDILDLFAAEHGPFTREQVARRIGLASDSGTFSTYMSALRSNNLIRKTAGGFKVSDELAL